MKSIDEEFSLIELKALVYDEIALLENLEIQKKEIQKKIQDLNARIYKRLQSEGKIPS